MSKSNNGKFGGFSRMRRAISLGAITALGPSMSAMAQPSGVYTFIVTFPPGGPADTIVRAIQQPLQAELGQPVIIENVPGAGGAIGAQKLMAAGPTGRTFMLATIDEAVLTPLALASARYKSEDLHLLSVLSRSDYALVARPNFPMDIHQLLKAKEPVTNGILGPASVYRLAMDDLKSRTGLKSTHVPYKGMANMVTDLIGGFVDVAFVPVAGSVPSMLAEGKFKLLATAAPARISSQPAVPTFNEVLNAKFEYAVAPAVVMHRDTPDDVVKKVHAALEKIKATAEFKKFTEQTGSTVMPTMSLAETEAFAMAERKRFKALAKAADITPQ